MSLLTTYNTVKNLLEKFPKYRDNDELLVVQIWYNELKAKGINVKTISAMDFLNYYKDNNLTTADCISRARRKVTEEHENLRGKSYHPRQKKQSEYKQEVKSLS